MSNNKKEKKKKTEKWKGERNILLGDNKTICR